MRFSKRVLEISDVVFKPVLIGISFSWLGLPGPDVPKIEMSDIAGQLYTEF